MLTGRDKLATQRQHGAKHLPLTGQLLMGFIDFYRRIVAERWAFLAARFPAFAAIGKGTAPGHAPVIVQRPDEGDIRFMRLHFLAKGDHLFQVQPVAVQHMKMQYQRAVSAGNRAI